MRKSQHTIYHLAILLAVILLSTSCKKTKKGEPQPEGKYAAVRYIDLNDRVLATTYIRLDLTGDAYPELLLMTQATGYGHYTQTEYQVLSTGSSRTATNLKDESTPVLQKRSKVHATNYDQYEWHPGNKVIVMKKIYQNGTERWAGDFLSNGRRYIPFQVIQGGKYHTAWIELSTDTQNERVIFHRAAIALEAETPILAGE